MQVEFKVKIPGHRQSVTLTKSDIRQLLTLREEGWVDLARRLDCSAENLSRLVNGKADFPILRKRLIAQLEKMIAEGKHRLSPALAMVV